MTVHEARCNDCAWSFRNEDLLEVSDEAERHAQKEFHDVDLERAVATDGGRDPSDLVVLVCDSCDYQTVVAVGAIPITSCPNCQKGLEIDESRVAHDCSASEPNHVIVGAGETCPFCDEVQHAVATDGGRDQDDTEYFVVDEDRGAVVAGPFRSKQTAAENARDRGPNHIVATEAVLELIELTSSTTIRWENDDVDVVTDGGQDAAAYVNEDVELRIRGKRVHVQTLLAILSTSARQLQSAGLGPAAALAMSVAEDAMSFEQVKGCFESMVVSNGEGWEHDHPSEALDVDLVSIATDGGSVCSSSTTARSVTGPENSTGTEGGEQS